MKKEKAHEAGVYPVILLSMKLPDIASRDSYHSSA
jgi:hypothetical protein